MNTLGVIKGTSANDISLSRSVSGSDMAASAGRASGGRGAKECLTVSADDRYTGTISGHSAEKSLREQMRKLSSLIGNGGEGKRTAGAILKDAAIVCFAGAGACFVGTVALPALALGGVALMGAGIASSLGFEFNDLLK
jgi:hypothetical protein